MFLAYALSCNPASAHRPYFTEVAPTALPNGKPGELRLLHGDGIFFVDPTRVVLLDQTGRLLALSRKGLSFSLNCDAGRSSCWAFDHESNRVLDLDPDRFRADGPVLLGRNERDGLETVEAAHEDWGFAPRVPSLFEYSQAQWTLARAAHPLIHLMLVALGALGATLIMVGFGRPKLERRWLLIALWVVKCVFSTTCLAVFGLIALYIALMVHISGAMWFGELLLGAGFVWALRAQARRIWRPNEPVAQHG